MSKPASTPFDGVAALLGRLDAIVRRALAAAEPLLRQPDSDPFRGLHIDADAIARTLTQPPAAPLFASADEETLPDGVAPGSPLARIAAAYGLDPFDVDVLIVALGPELDLRYERIYSYLQDDVTRRRPAVNLALDLLCTSAEDKLRRRAHFSAAAPLLRHRVIEWVDDPHRSQPSLLTAAYRADPQIVRCVAGDGGLDARLAHCATLITRARPVLVPDPGSASARVVAAVERAGIDDGDALTLCFHGPDESERTAAAHAVASVAHRVLLHVDLARDPEIEPLLPIVFREAELHAAVLLLDRWDSLSGSPALRTLQARLRTHAGTCILSGERPWIPGPLGPPGVVAEHFGVPPAEVRTARWAESLEFTTGSIDEELARTLGGRFRLSADRIWDAALTARQLAQARNGADLAGGPCAEDFFAAARRQCGHELASIATRVALSATWEDIVLPADSLAQLRELCARIALSHRVLDEWGFDRRLSHGKGVAALFSGPSGTGKTMAAEVVANELGLDLYRVEIPAVMSKWIGETEKNLDKVFRCAENAILFFDEADALFGKRSEVRDAHDRYANVEISYLLQRIETFDGLAILATNVRHHMDEAFLRRLTFVIQFPFPDDAQRQQIWERIWPAETPLAPDLDLGRISRMFRLAGGNVKNVALAAAFAAAERGDPVTMADVAHAVRREYQKLGKNLADAAVVEAAEASLAGVRG
jgi:hypothetical protein